MSDTAAGDASPPAPGDWQAGQRQFLGHPRGLLVLAATEFWDRVSFHGMQALLVLYMVEQLLLPGHVENVAGFAAFRASIEGVTGPLSTQALAFQVFGIYLGFVYITPLLGGVLGDRVLGRHRTVVLGALLMTAGHLCMAFERSFLLALALLTLGAGCLRGNLVAQVGALYAAGDRRRPEAFQYYAASVNGGAFLAPLICGLLAKLYGWHVGFGFAAFGMLAGLLVYLAGRRHLPPDQPRSAARERTALTSRERRVVVVLVLLMVVLSCFWIAQSQVWNVYNIWVRDYVDLEVGGWTMPVPWIQSIDGLAPLVTMPLVVAFWRRQAGRGREPDELTKLGIGCLVFGLATCWLAAGNVVDWPGGRIPLAWSLGFHVFSNVGWVFFAPTVLALLARTAPASVSALTIGAYYLSVFIGSLVSGRLGVLYEQLAPHRFWLLHAALVGGGGVLVLLLRRRLNREFAPAG